MISKEALLQKYNISEEAFAASSIEWEDLEFIYNDFSTKVDTYKNILAEFQKEYLENISEQGIHSIRTRVKDAEHLIVKIIRKRQENFRKYQNLTRDNYEKFLTDLIGIRCFILFKSDWQKFHSYIEEKIEDNPEFYVKDCIEDFDNDCTHTYMAEMPKVHIRTGDSKTIYEKLLQPDAIKSKKIYRSAHYIIKYHGVYIEIQVRTLFEEGWGEVDHYMVYPYYQEDPLFQEYTGLLNRLTGLADEMSSFFIEVKRLEIEHLEQNQQTDINYISSDNGGLNGENLNVEHCPVCPLEEGKVVLETTTAAECITKVLNE